MRSSITQLKHAVIDQFYNKMGYKPDLSNPSTINEWIAVWKLEEDPLLKRYTDKITAKDTLSGITRPIPTIYSGDIDWEPNGFPFIAKPNNRSAGTSLISNIKEWRSFKHWYNTVSPYWKKNLETNYRDIPQKVLIEPVLKDFVDVKVTCIYGEPKFIEVYTPRVNAPINFPQGEGNSFFDLNGDIMDVVNKKHPKGVAVLPDIPLHDILNKAYRLSNPFKFVRIDFMVNNNIYFGEYSFFVGGGYTKYNPPEFATNIGSWITR